MDEMEQNRTYMPTKAEEKLLEVLVNPENKDKTVSEICALANIGRRTYYDIFKKTEFVNYYQQLSFELVKQAVMPVINSVAKEAKAGSFQHSKMILEMAQMYTEKIKQEHSGGVSIVLEGVIKEWAK